MIPRKQILGRKKPKSKLWSVNSYKYYVIQFLEKPFEDIDDYVCIPWTWIRLRAKDQKVIVSYPSKNLFGTNEDNIILCKERKEDDWTRYLAEVVYGTDSFDNAQCYITEKLINKNNGDKSSHMNKKRVSKSHEKVKSKIHKTQRDTKSNSEEDISTECSKNERKDPITLKNKQDKSSHVNKKRVGKNHDKVISKIHKTKRCTKSKSEENISTEPSKNERKHPITLKIKRTVSDSAGGPAEKRSKVTFVSEVPQQSSQAYENSNKNQISPAKGKSPIQNGCSTLSDGKKSKTISQNVPSVKIKSENKSDQLNSEVLLFVQDMYTSLYSLCKRLKIILQAADDSCDSSGETLITSPSRSTTDVTIRKENTDMKTERNYDKDDDYNDNDHDTHTEVSVKKRLYAHNRKFFYRSIARETDTIVLIGKHSGEPSGEAPTTNVIDVFKDTFDDEKGDDTAEIEEDDRDMVEDDEAKIEEYDVAEEEEDSAAEVGHDAAEEEENDTTEKEHDAAEEEDDEAEEEEYDAEAEEEEYDAEAEEEEYDAEAEEEEDDAAEIEHGATEEEEDDATEEEEEDENDTGEKEHDAAEKEAHDTADIEKDNATKVVEDDATEVKEDGTAEVKEDVAPEVEEDAEDIEVKDDDTNEDYDGSDDPDIDLVRDNEVSVKKRRIRKFFLPPEYDENDPRWTLKHRGPAPGLVELVEHSGVYVDGKNLHNCKLLAKDCRTLVRKLLFEVFTKSALSACSMTGGKPIGYEGSMQRPGLDPHATTMLREFVKKYGAMRGWSNSKQLISIAIRNKMQSLRTCNK